MLLLQGSPMVPQRVDWKKYIYVFLQKQVPWSHRQFTPYIREYSLTCFSYKGVPWSHREHSIAEEHRVKELIGRALPLTCFSDKGVPWSHREWNEKKYICVSPEASPMVPQTVYPLNKREVLWHASPTRESHGPTVFWYASPTRESHGPTESGMKKIYVFLQKQVPWSHRQFTPYIRE